ncbi:amidohydrolase family protein [Pseudomaricurvus alkylphenolicus]|uniref:amidohydrolase family protein n=1 Tax=Pseudomaricurvus alkylphenolicus TaxID=1306991 RepID=UPI00141D7EA2|nr:amidohydrolase family protein [Pseudomaricurvus alkylphenolicus]NIB44893.1 amidohydrolase family protein [Pseudomaricurvus alkylphenolicus]
MPIRYLLVIASLLSMSGAMANDYVIENVNLVPMTEEVVKKNHSVLVKSGKIAKICKQARQCLDGGAQRIDGSGKYLIPGLADMHAHTSHIPELAKKNPVQRGMFERIQSQQLRQYAMFGVTTIRDTGGGELNLEARKKIEQGKATGPRIYTSKGAMDGNPTLHNATLPFDDPKVAADYVRQSVAEGYDLIKIYSTLTKPVFDAIIDAAKESNTPVIGHVPMQIDMEYVLQKGLRSIEHLSGFGMFCAGYDAGLKPVMDDVYQGLNYCTPEKVKSVAEMTAKYPVWVDPTLIVQDNVKTEWDRHTRYNKEEASFTPPMLQVFQEWLFEIFHPRPRAGLKASKPVRKAIVKALNDAGVPLLVGTDTMATGYNVHQELALLVEAGLTPYQALVAATSEPARYFDKEGEFGTIVEGANADIVLLDKNPLSDIENAKAIRGVMMQGQWWPKAKIDAELAAIQAEYKADFEMVKAMQAASH